GRFPPGHYTDDTEMMISLLEALVRAKGFDPALTAARFLANFHPERGYGGRIYGLMDRLAAGEPWDKVGTDSYGNGSAMRAAPIGFFFYDDLERLAEAAATQASITHRHPEALAGAVIQAGAVALALRAGLKKRPIERLSFLQTLAGLARDFDQTSARRLLSLADLTPGQPQEVILQIRSLYRCNVKAVEAVPPAIAAFLLTEDFQQAVILAVNLGGDTDTIGAMAGAAAGAYYGLKGLPPVWVRVLENGSLGRDYVVNLCQKAVDIKTGPEARQAL
ncbi:MAG: ADP-ribosylglycohydrolase family protein, partial [Thermodesulfobacteriota bacterium]|nr:ADP-ribosylglycohydrolase family protein [Thermodesulfobacteriota bacterium]